jgi:hypothetical protein
LIWTKGGGDLVDEQMEFGRVLAALRWSSKKLKSAIITRASTIDVFVLFVPPLSELLNQSLARLTCVTNNHEVKLATELEVVLSGEGLGEAIGDLISGGDPLDFDELVLDLFSGVMEGDVDVLRAVAVVSLLLRHVDS